MVTGSSVSYSDPYSFTAVADSTDSYYSFNTDVTNSKFTVSATVFLDPGDDTVSYAFTGGNYSNQALTFTLDFDMDLTPGLSYDAAFSQITGNGTTATAPFTATVPVGNTNVLTASASTVINGAVTGLGVNNGTACSSGANTSFVCTYPQANSTFSPIEYVELVGAVSFVLPGSNEANSSEANYMGWDGEISLVAVPEPADASLIGAGLAVLAFLRRRKRTR
jgi:hypothetical protein